MNKYNSKMEIISSHELSSWYFEFDATEMTTIEQASKLDDILRKKLKFCYPYKIEPYSLKPVIQMNPNDPPLKEVLEKNKEFMELVNKYRKWSKPSQGPDIVIDWSVNHYLKLKGKVNYKKVLVKPGDFQFGGWGDFPAITTMIYSSSPYCSNSISFYTNSHIWFPRSSPGGSGTAKKNIPFLNKALEMLDKELKPKNITFDRNEFNGAKLFKHGLYIGRKPIPENEKNNSALSMQLHNEVMASIEMRIRQNKLNKRTIK